MANVLYYGDNLDIMQRYIADESIDLVYLDPPFNSAQNYNVLFAEKDGSKSASQITAFEDTWTWDKDDEEIYADLVTKGGKLADCLEAFRKFIGPCDMLAYLVMMAPRLAELRRVLKPTGSIYLHCDPSASHYLKMLMDAVYGPENFKNEIIWKRTGAKGLAFTGFPSNHDVILYYAKSDAFAFNRQYIPYDLNNLDEKTAGKYCHQDNDGRRYQLDNLTNPNPDRPNLTYEFLGITRVWRWTKERMTAAYKNGIVVQTGAGKVPRLKRYLDEQEGRSIDDIWIDIYPLNSQAQERMGYPTQKPEALLDRIISASSNEGDVILDPFCGCGTSVSSAEKLKRQWIGIDVTHLAINLIRRRLKDTYGEQIKFDVIGEPVSVPDAERLAESDPYQFQWWALGLVGARPVEQKKGADKGIDGTIIFQGDSQGTFERVMLSVKAGGTSVAHIRDLRGVIEREKASIGVLICMQEPTKPMRTEATTAGFYESKTWGKRYPKIQILTVEDLLNGKKVDMPPIKQMSKTFKVAPKIKGKRENLELGI